MDFTLPCSAPPTRLKTFLQQLGLSGTYWKKLKAAGALTVNGEVLQRDALLQPDDIVRWHFLPEHSDLLPEEAPLDILLETELLLAVNKPAGLVTHNAGKERTPSLSRRVAWYYHQHHLPCGIHPVSRLDRETSGIVLFAKNACVHHMLSTGDLRKTYLGLTLGHWKQPEGLIALPIGRRPGSIVERQVDPDGAPASTRYKVLEERGNLSLVQFLLETGRTHQIRVHCAALDHPLLGDTLYGAPGVPGRHYLHAWKLALTVPFTGEPLTLTAPVPEDFTTVWQKGTDMV